jgi:hypothetical protein
MPDGCRVAVEIELNIKSKPRMTDRVAGHIHQMVKGHYSKVYFFTPHLAALKRVFKSVEAIKMDGVFVKISEYHRSRFILMDIRMLKNTVKPGNSVSSVIIDLSL